MATPEHSKILTAAARRVLRPAGMQQRGRSRRWLDDQGFWVGLVELQPSSWTRGTNLNVGVTWLWHLSEQMTYFYDLSYRVKDLAVFESIEQFTLVANEYAHAALTAIVRFREQLPHVEEAADVLMAEAKARDGWPRWHAAVALGLARRTDDARAMFQAVIDCGDDRPWWVPVQERAARWRDLVRDDEPAFRAEVDALVQENRRALRLSPRAGLFHPP